MNKLLLALFAAVAISCFALAVDADCASRNSTCSHCVDQFECYWCEANRGQNKSTCVERKVYQLLVDCSSTYHLYPSCAISGLAVLIIMIVCVVLVVVIITTCICCCCCCSGKRSKRKWLKEDDRDMRERDERKSRQEGRERRHAAQSDFTNSKSERKQRNDEIRKKYGLYKEGEGGGGGSGSGTGTEGRYQRFDV